MSQMYLAYSILHHIATTSSPIITSHAQSFGPCSLADLSYRSSCVEQKVIIDFELVGWQTV